MKTDDFETEYEFHSKYENTNPIAKYLIDNFFKGIENCLKNIKSQTYHEIGCGEAFSTIRIIEMIPQSSTLTASDIEDKNIIAAQKRLSKVSFLKENVYELPYADKEIDTVFLLEVLEHLDYPEKALQEILRVTKNEAVISVQREPIWRMMNMARGKYISDLGNTPGHFQHWSQRSFIKMVSKYAEVLQVEAPIPWTILRIKPKN